MKKITKKLAFSTTTVRQLQQTISEEQLQGVAGGTIVVGPGGGGGGDGIGTALTTGGGGGGTAISLRSIDGYSKGCPQAC